jgi:chromosome partitioning protein
MPILTIASSKGGAGKTTVARALVAALVRQEIDLLVVDADPTKALHRWISSIYEGAAVSLVAESREEALNDKLPDWAAQHALVLVDTPGFANAASLVSIAAADFVLVPTMTSEADLVEARTTVKRVEGFSKAARRPILARVLMNAVQNTLVQGHAADTVAAEGLPRLTATLGHRAVFKAVSHSGEPLTTGPAYREVAKLVRELQEMGWVPTRRKAA